MYTVDITYKTARSNGFTDVFTTTINKANDDAVGQMPDRIRNSDGFEVVDISLTSNR